MVEMIMDLSRLENGRLKGSFRRHNLGRVTGGVAVSYTPSATLTLRACSRNQRPKTPSRTW